MVALGADELRDLRGMSLDVRSARRDGGAAQLKQGLSSVCHVANGRRSCTHAAPIGKMKQTGGDPREPLGRELVI